jgi:DNA polymerase
MSGMSARDAAFLQEMGIGPLWTLRDVPTAAELAPEDEAIAAQSIDEQNEAGVATPFERAAQAEPAAAAWDEAGSAAAETAWAGEQAATPAAARGAAGTTPANAPSVARGPAGTAPAAAPVVARGAPDGEPTDEDIARMGWDELRDAVANCSRCGACKDGRKPVFGAGARQAAWFVAAGASTVADEQAGSPLAGDTGTLLDNMLAAVDLSRERDVYVTNLIKCRPTSAKGGDRAPTAEEAAACRPYLERELALSKAGAVLTLGQIAANALLDQPLSAPLAGSRGSVHELHGVPLVATLHPGELLRRGADKALAWVDLCRARAARARPG